LDGGPAFWPKEVYRDSILIDYINASKLKIAVNKPINSQSTLNTQSKLILERLVDDIHVAQSAGLRAMRKKRLILK
jgi:hypothetical protein